MKLFATIAIALGLLSTAYAADEVVNKTGSVKSYLMNPEGDVDGLLLKDGSQVKFPPHMSEQLVTAVAPNDEVAIKGYKENDKVVKADSITNTKSKKVVAETRPEPPVAGRPMKGPKERRDSLSAMTAEGKVEAQIFGRRGEVNGVILTDGTLVRFSPRVASDSKIKSDAGATIKATGFGTKNTYGRSMEATEITN